MHSPERSEFNQSLTTSDRPPGSAAVSVVPVPPTRPANIPDDVAALAEASSDLVLGLSEHGSLVFLNRAGREMLGLPADASLLPALDDLLGEDERAVLRALMTEEEPAIALGELRFRRPALGTEIALTCRLLRLNHPGGERRAAVVGIRPDPRLLEEPVDAGREDAGPAHIMELLGGVVGHDLRNPLNAILTSAYMVLRQSEAPGAQSAMKRIIASGHRMQRMIDQLLDLTRLRVGGGILLHPRPGELKAIVEQVASEIRTTHPGWPVIVDVSGCTRGSWDSDRMAQALSNLLGNAVQHGTREAGVRIAMDGTSPDSLTVTVQNAGSIPAVLLPVIFSPFRGLHHGRNGSNGLGLGLYITRQIIAAHGGEIRAQSDDATTTFTITLPRDPASRRSALPSPDIASDDVAALRPLTATAPGASTTARLFGAPALHERAPQEYWAIVERYGRLLDQALDRQTYKGAADSFSDELRRIADELGALDAGPREIAELHGRTLRLRTRDVNTPKSQALTNEGRIVAFELMGHLLSYYRRRSGLVQKGS